jgi:hypothetical protein
VEKCAENGNNDLGMLCSVKDQWEGGFEKRHRRIRRIIIHSDVVRERNSLIDEWYADTKSSAQALQRQASITLQQLAVSHYPHLPNIISCVGGQNAGRDEVGFFEGG